MRVQRRLSNLEFNLDLSTVLGQGGEAHVYSVPADETLVAKIYHAPTESHGDKIIAMLAKPPENPTAGLGHISIAWPVEALWTADGNHSIVGFLMPHIRDMRPIIDFYNPKTRRQNCPLFNYQYLHRTARNLAAAFAALHAGGYCIGDVNESNILVSDTALVTIVDTDSFQVPDPQKNILHRCLVGKPEFTPPELHDRTFADCDRLVTHDSFGLAVLLFQLLMEGTHPFSGIYTDAGEPPTYETRIEYGHFTYSKQRRVPYIPTPTAPKWEILHPSLQQLFIRCFEEGHQNPHLRPDAQSWVTALTEAENSLVSCANNSQHRYGNHLHKCPWCSRTLQLDGRDPFPSIPAIQAGTHLKPHRRKSMIPLRRIYPQVHLQPVKTTKVRQILALKEKYLPVFCGVLALVVLGYVDSVTKFSSTFLSPQANYAQQMVTTGNSNQTNFAANYTQGHAFYKIRDYDQAVEKFTEAIKQNPEYAKAYVNRGNALYNLKDYEGAIRDYGKALQINPSEVKAYVNRGNIRYTLAESSGDPDKEYNLALSDFNHALILNPEESEAYIRRGIVRSEIAKYSGDSQRDYKKAIDDFNQAIHFNTDKAEAYFQRGVVRYEIAKYKTEFTKEYRQALEDFNQALRLNAHLAKVYVKRGIVRYELAQYDSNKSSGDYDGAIADLKTAAKLFLEQRDLDSYQQALGNICIIVENKCDALLQNPEKYLEAKS